MSRNVNDLAFPVGPKDSRGGRLPFSGLNDKSSLVVQEMVQAAGSIPSLLRLVFIEIILIDEVFAFRGLNDKCSLVVWEMVQAARSARPCTGWYLLK